MVKVQFLGRVFPADAIRVSIVLAPVNWKNTDTGADANFVVSIKDSAVTIDCDANSTAAAQFTYLYFRAMDLVRAPVDLMGFSQGVGLTVILETYVDENGVPHPIVPQDPALREICTAYDLTEGRGDDFNTVLMHVIRTPEIFMALNDLISSLIMPHYGPRVAAQVVETLRIKLSPSGTPVKKTWENLRTTLRLSEEYLRFISDHGTGPRHGDRTHIPPHITKEMAKRAAAVMNRYFEYVRRGEILKPEADFPIL